MSSRLVDRIWSIVNRFFGFSVASRVDTIIYRLAGYTAWSSTSN